MRLKMTHFDIEFYVFVVTNTGIMLCTKSSGVRIASLLMKLKNCIYRVYEGLLKYKDFRFSEIINYYRCVKL